jgi:hypothetical protein
VLDDFPELPEPVLAPGFAPFEDEPDEEPDEEDEEPDEDEPDEGVFWSVPEDFSVVDEEPAEEPFCCLSLEPLDAVTRLSLR